MAFFGAEGEPTDDAAAMLTPLRDGTIPDLDDRQILIEALSLATINWQFEMIEFLLKKGADINGHDVHCHSGNHTPLHHACSSQARVTHHTEPTMVAFLIDHGADPLIRDAGNADSEPPSSTSCGS